VSRRVVVVTAGLSQPSSTRLLADQLATATEAAVGARGEGVEIDVIELRELAVEMAQTLVSGNRPTPGVVAAHELIAAADGMIVVTPVFTASYSGLFKTFVDLLDPKAIDGMPVIVAATAGTARHSLVLDHALRPLFTYLHAVVVPTGVFAATDDFGGGEGGASLQSRVNRAAAELAALVVRERTIEGFVQGERDTRKQAHHLEAPTGFAQLLRGHDGR
jgi:FMN reductase